MAQETVRSLKDLLVAIEKHYQEQVGPIDVALAVNLRDHGFSGVQAELEARRKIQTDVFEAAAFRLKIRMKAAVEREAAEAKVAADLLAKQAEAVKARAGLEYLRAGGTAAEFEQSWPSMRSQMLSAEALRLMSQKPAPSKITL